MRLSPRELEGLAIHQAGFLAQKRLARGLRLNHPETVALISCQIQEFVRNGENVAELMNKGRQLLGHRQVMKGVGKMIREVQVEATFPDGTKLCTIHNPICRRDGDLTLALEGSFLPVPKLSVFSGQEDEKYDGTPEIKKILEREVGALLTADGAIEINKGRQTKLLKVVSTCDRPIQVGSHYHFTETNKFLVFDRLEAYGMKLNIPSGTSVRFEPGETKVVNLVEISGRRIIRGGNSICDGPYDPKSLPKIKDRVISRGFGHEKQAVVDPGPIFKMPRLQYAVTYGPTVGDRHFSVVILKKYSARFTVSGHYFQQLSASLTLTTAATSLSAKNRTGRSNSSREFIAGKLASQKEHTTFPEVSKVRLGDTSLLIQVMEDYTFYGDECKFGAGKVLREGMGQESQTTSEGYIDTIITNALILDPVLGIVKADVGIKEGKIVGIGKAGNPDVMSNVDPNLHVGAGTEAIAGEGLILTAGGIDSHVHFICPQQIKEAVASGLTTLIGGGTGPATGTCATTCTPGPNHIRQMIQSTDCFPLNFGFTGKGSTSCGQGLAKELEEQIEAGAIGLKLHEDWGTTPAAIDCCLRVAEALDVQVTIHTDSLNESCCVEETIETIGSRTIHSYHTEGAGGGHAPDILKICGRENVLPSSTNPTRPFTVNTIEEHLDMLMVCHNLDKNLKEDVAFAESRIRAETIAAEDILHDLGAISMMSSDSQAMGRIGEVITRTWQTADKMKRQFGPLPEDSDQNDNTRALRYIAKYTINPAISHGIQKHVGSVEVGKLADLVLWKSEFFGVKPQIVIKGGQIAWAQMGMPNASIPTPEPVKQRKMFGAYGRSVGKNSITFVSKLSLDKVKHYGIEKDIVAVSGCRNLKKKDMIWNDFLPKLKINPETYKVHMLTVEDNEQKWRHLTCAPASCLPLAQRYFLI